MQDKIRNQIKRIQERIGRHKKQYGIISVAAVMVVLFVAWQLMLPGVAMTTEPVCGMQEHVHDETCYQSETGCGLEEHTHTLDCYSDPSADLETSDVWESTFANVTLSGTWTTDVVAIAQTQIGYAESTNNVVWAEDGSEKGYTRHGEWRGEPYSDWDMAFVAFCLNYAGVPADAFPVDYDLNQMITALQTQGYLGANTDQPEVGDLIFLQKQEQETALQVGIVSAVAEENGITYIYTIEGNSENQVKENKYEIGSGDIVGYGYLHSAEESYKKPTEDVQTFENPDQNIAEIAADDETVSQRLTVNLSPTADTAKTGLPLRVNVNSTYSGANRDEKADVWIEVGALPEGISIIGFNAEGERNVGIGDDATTLHLITDNGITYIHYETSQGSTINFDLQFTSTNGTMPKSTEVEVKVNQDRTTVAGEPLNQTIDTVEGTAKLTWTADNSWDKVDKTVSSGFINVDGNDISGDGLLHYTIQANGNNHEASGEIWTDYIEVTDTLTLENGNMWFPADAAYNAADKKVYTGDKILVDFNNLDGGEITSFEWVTDAAGKKVGITYTVKVPNNNLGTSNADQEQKNLNLSMDLHSGNLELVDNYYQVTSDRDIIRNHVDFTAVPYKNYDDNSTSEDTVETKLQASAERGSLNKTVTGPNGSETVEPGDTVTYTITFENTGTVPIVVKDDNGNLYAVTDRLPEQLKLTEAQIAAIEKNGATYNESTRTISWIPSESDIPTGEKFKFEFEATVKTAEELVADGQWNNQTISNSASYKGWTSPSANITFEKAEITISKEGDKETVENGDTITYTIKVKNDSKIDAAIDEILKDTLPSGLEFVSATIGNEKNITESGEYDVTVNGNKYTVDFTLDGQNLTWNVGKLKAGDEIELTYECKVNADHLSNPESVTNRVTSSSTGGSSSETGVTPPISIEKSVAQDTDTVYPDKTVFDYEIKITNDKDHPSDRDDLVLEDSLPAGMLPYDCILYKETTFSRWGVDPIVSTKEVEWGEFFSSYEESHWNDGQYIIRYYAEIDGEKVGVTAENDKTTVKLTWSIGSMDPGQTITKKYKAQISLTEDQVESGEKVPFTNRATINRVSSEVTVTGGSGREMGNLEFLKNIWVNNTFINAVSLSDEMKEALKDITFTITGIDTEGNPVVFKNGNTSLEIEYQEMFTWKADENYYTIPESVPAGTYTITETRGEKNQNITEYDFTNVAYTSCVGGIDKSTNVVTIGDDQTGQFKIDNYYVTHQETSADIQKSVWSMYQSEDGAVHKSSNKEYFTLPEANNETNYVLYNISIINSGTTDISVNKWVDVLPDGLEYVGMLKQRWQTDAGATDPSDKINTISWQNEFIKDFSGGVTSVDITKTSEEKRGEIEFSVTTANGNTAATLPGGNAITFLVACKIDPDVEINVPLMNTAKLIVDSSVGYKDYPEVDTVNTPFDTNQNNGGSRDEGIDADGNRVISSSVNITPSNKVVPGITKEAISSFRYNDQDVNDETALPTDSNIDSDSIVKWEVKLYNDGVVDMTDYDVADAVTYPFQLITTDLAAAKGITQPYSLQIFNYTGNSVSEAKDVSSKLETESLNESGKNSYRFDFSDSEYTIPAGGYAVLTLYTSCDTVYYNTYVNNAVLYPSQDFDANGVVPGHGALVKDGDEYVGVEASDVVYAMGAYGSISWKEIQEEDDLENYASGNPATGELNYITIDDDNRVVRYTNNIRNVSTSQFQNMVVIDTLPHIGDLGVVNQNDQRGSEFTVTFLQGLHVYDQDTEGNVTEIDSSHYQIQFSNEASFSSGDFAGEANEERWHNAWEEGDLSFRIVFTDDFALASQHTLQVQYNGHIEDDANPGEIAWNSFGYQYRVPEYSEALRAEPPKVGVRIPADSIIKKEVVDSQNNNLGLDANQTFTFHLYEGNAVDESKIISTFEIAQGSSIKFSELQDKDGNRLSLANGKEYTIAEDTSALSDFELIGIGLEGTAPANMEYTFTYHDSQQLVVVARNQKTTYYELPKTGGIGTLAFTVGGALLMLAAWLIYGYRRKKLR